MNPTTIQSTPATKTCTRCGETKSVDQFCISKYTNDGHDYYCRECRKYLHQDYRLRNSETLKQKRYSQNESHKIVQRQRNLHYYKANRELLLEKRRIYRLAHRERISAQKLVESRIKAGLLTPASEHLCWICGIGQWENPSVKMEYHHPDYRERLGVVPLCTSCHKRLHAGIKKETTDERNN